MIPYSGGLLMNNNNNYGIVKTEALFGFGPDHSVAYNQSDPLKWIFSPVNMERSLQENTRIARAAPTEVAKKAASKKSEKKAKGKSKKRKSKKVNKCIFKVLKKKGKGGGGKRGKFKLSKKMFMPVILGLLAAKSVLIPVALKALAFMSAKGLMMGFFSTVMASVLSLKGMFDTSHRYQDRKDEKTQVEIIQVPTKEDHYFNDHYRRVDYLPIPLPDEIAPTAYEKKRTVLNT